MTRIRNSSNALISSRVQLQPRRKDPVHVKNRLLNGELHIQTIGAAIDLIDAVFLCDKSQLALFESAYAIGEPLTIQPKTGDSYQVMIDLIGAREIISYGVVEYEVSATLVVKV